MIFRMRNYDIIRIAKTENCEHLKHMPGKNNVCGCRTKREKGKGNLNCRRHGTSTSG